MRKKSYKGRPKLGPLTKKRLKFFEFSEHNPALPAGAVFRVAGTVSDMLFFFLRKFSLQKAAQVLLGLCEMKRSVVRRE